MSRYIIIILLGLFLQASPDLFAEIIPVPDNLEFILTGMDEAEDFEWMEQAKLIADDAEGGDVFGASVSISGDYAIVGAFGDDNYSGSAYIFSLDDDEWIQQPKLTAEDAEEWDVFGASVSISGEYAIVGASLDDDGGNSSGSAYIFSLDDGEWIQQAKLIAEDAGDVDRFGGSVSISGDYAIVGAFGDDNYSGSAYIFVRDGDDWTQQAKLTAEDADEQDRFGYSVSISGDHAIVGAPDNFDDDRDSGSAYIFVRDGDDWTQQAKLTADDAEAEDSFGQSVSISGDYAIVGAEYDDDDGENSGSAYIFVSDGDDWTQQAKLTADDAEAGDEFGHSVSISGDCAIVGAHGFGSAYKFSFYDGEWIQQAKLTAEDGEAGDHFGHSVSISGDNAIVGAYGDDGSGSAYIYHPGIVDPDYGEWMEQAKLIADDGAALDQFGYSVSISGDYAIVGANGDDDDGDNSGSACIFSLDDGEWIEQAKLTADDGAGNDWYGFSSSISGDYAIVGAWGDDDAGGYSGSAYILSLDGGEWTQQAKLTAEDADAGDNFGNSVSISGDYAIVGAPGDDDHAGSAYIFSLDDGEWIQQAKLTAEDAGADDLFGAFVSISGDYAIVGAWGDDDRSGSAYIFVRDNGEWTQQAKLTADAVDRFGLSVSISGDYAIVGANSDGDGESSGCAYIFVRDGDDWTQQAKLTAEDADEHDRFGYSVSISGDYAIVGAYQNDDDGDQSGSAYIFVRNDGEWIQQAKLTADDADAEDYFGASVSISGDYAIVGASFDDDNGDRSGSAYIFQHPVVIGDPAPPNITYYLYFGTYIPFQGPGPVLRITPLGENVRAGEVFTIPSYDLANYNLGESFQVYMDGIAGTTVEFEEGAIDEDIELHLVLNNLVVSQDQVGGMVEFIGIWSPDQNVQNLLWMFADFQIWTTDADSVQVNAEEDYGFLDENHMVVSVPLDNEFHAMMDAMGLDYDALGAAFWLPNDEQWEEAGIEYAEVDIDEEPWFLVTVNHLSQIINGPDGVYGDPRYTALEEGWNLISVNYLPEDYLWVNEDGPDMEKMFRQLTIGNDHNPILMVKDERGRFFAPPHDNFNNIHHWNMLEGYRVKIEEGNQVVWFGDEVPHDTDIPIEEGWNNIAFLPNYELPADGPEPYVLGPILDDVIIAKDVHGRFMYPRVGFSNMPPWRPTQGYQVKVAQDVVLNYPDPPEGDDFVQGTRIEIPDADRHWLKSDITESNMSVLISSISGIQLGEHTEIGAFSPAGLLVGEGVVGTGGRCGLAIWGDDPTTDKVDGLREGEAFKLRLWISGVESDLTLTSLLEGDLTYSTNALTLIDVVADVDIPTEYFMSAGYPNPFNSNTRLNYGLPEATNAKIQIYDVSGRLVTTLINGKYEAGYHHVTWDADAFATGIYLVRMRAGDFEDVKKVTLLK